MPILFVSNPTKQIRKWYYRLDFNVKGVSIEKQPAKHIEVKSGRQIRLDFDHVSQLESVVQQFNRYGARAVSEKNRLGDKSCPMVWSVDKPVPGVVIEETHMHNRGVMRARSERNRKAIALASSAMVQDAVDATLGQFNADKVDVKLFEAEIEQVENNDAPVMGKEVAEGLRVLPQEPQRNKPGPKPGFKRNTTR